MGEVPDSPVESDRSIVIEGERGFPPLMLVSNLRFNRHSLEGLHEAYRRCLDDPRHILVVDGSVALYQLVDGRWSRLEAPPVEVWGREIDCP